jgi:translation initiation factor 4E
MFKEGIDPSWEDPINSKGAEWRIRKFNHKDPLYEVDGIWIRLLMLTVGESETQGLGITGIRVVDSSNIKNKKCLYNVEIWFENKDSKRDVENFIKSSLRLESTKCFYRTHETDY